MSEIYCDATEDIVCPYCGHANEPSYLIDHDFVDGERFDMDCDGCGRDFAVECSITILFGTEKEEATEE